MASETKGDMSLIKDKTKRFYLHDLSQLLQAHKKESILAKAFAEHEGKNY